MYSGLGRRAGCAAGIRAGASGLALSQACPVVLADALIAHLQRYFNSRSGIVTVIKIKEVVDQLEKAAGATERVTNVVQSIAAKRVPTWQPPADSNHPVGTCCSTTPTAFMTLLMPLPAQSPLAL